MINIIREKLASYKPKALSSPKDICAGVIMPLFEKKGDIFILLTKRSEGVKVHKGEVSFPGGMCEDKDGNTMFTALRECREEIGVMEKDVEVIGMLDDMITVTGFIVTPYVGIIPHPYQFKTNPNEVAYIIFLPIDYLMNADLSLERAEHMGKSHVIPAIYYKGDRIWGATCRMLLQFKKILGSATP